MSQREREILRGQLWKKDDEEKRQSHDLQQAKGPVSAVFIMLLLFHYKENRWILSHHFFLNRQSLRISELWWLLPFQFNSTVESNKNFSSNTLSLSLSLSPSLHLPLSLSLPLSHSLSLFLTVVQGLIHFRSVHLFLTLHSRFSWVWKDRSRDMSESAVKDWSTDKKSGRRIKASSSSTMVCISWSGKRNFFAFLKYKCLLFSLYIWFTHNTVLLIARFFTWIYSYSNLFGGVSTINYDHLANHQSKNFQKQQNMIYLPVPSNPY